MIDICTNCHIGLLQTQLTTWAKTVNSYLVILPGIRATVCDVCGKTEFDQTALGRLQLLLFSGDQLANMIQIPPTQQTATLARHNDWLTNHT